MKRVLLLLLLSGLFLPALAGEVGALCIRDSGVAVYARNGSWRTTINCSEGAVDAQSDGSTIAILHRNGTVSIYDRNGSWRGHINAGNGVRLQVVCGCIIVHHANGHASVYNSAGSWCGSL